MAVLIPDDVVTLAEAKLHLRVTHALEDSLIEVYRLAAISDLGAYMRRPLLPKSVVDYFKYRDLVPNINKIYLSTPNAGSVVVAKRDDTGYVDLVEGTDYILDEVAENPHILFIDIPSYDDFGADANVLRVSYTSTLPTLEPQMKAAVLLLLGSLYENREDVVVGATARKIPLSVEYLLSPFRFIRFGK